MDAFFIGIILHKRVKHNTAHSYYICKVSKKLVIIGGGAAGFFCAINTAVLRKDIEIIIVEKQHKVLQKVKVSGGGRCNVTHDCASQSILLNGYPRGKQFLKKAFQIFSSVNTVDWFLHRGIGIKKEQDGRMFPMSNSSQTIIDCLLNEVDKYNIKLQLNTELISLERIVDQWKLAFKNNQTLLADAVFIGTGGFPKIEQYHLFQKLGHSIEPPVPSLFTFNTPHSSLKTLMGLVMENATVKIAGSKLSETGPVLITHWGLSGPAILRLSAWGARELHDKNYHFTIIINAIGMVESKLRNDWPLIRNQQGGNKVSNKNPFGLASRLWDYFLQLSEIVNDTKWSELPSKEQNRLIHFLTSYELEVEGKTTFKEEFVTCGGISLQEVDPTTMESKKAPNLYFGGEILDVDGITGGYNFQHAWTSGFVAAQAIANKI